MKHTLTLHGGMWGSLCFMGILVVAIVGFIGSMIEALWVTLLASAATLIVMCWLTHRYLKHIKKELVRIFEILENPPKSTSKIQERFIFEESDMLYKRLRKILKQVQKKEAKIRLKNQQRSDILLAIAHEFRNPIASIMGYAQTLVEEKQMPHLLQERFLHKIYHNGEKIEALLSRLLLWNRFESNEAKLKKTNVSLYHIIQEAIRGAKERFPNRSIHIKGEDIYIEGDRELLEIAIKNLIENGLKYSDDDVVVRLGKQTIHIIDKGEGISSKEIEKITKKFYRGHARKWDNSMGLGLAIVKKILDLHQMRLEIRSKLKQGSEFIIHL